MKKIFMLIVATAIIMSISTCFATQEFYDVPESHWAHKAIITLNDFGIITGYPDGTFQPNHYITRAEFAKIIVPVLDLKESSNVKSYTDVPKDYWAYDYIRTVGQLYPTNASGDASKFMPMEPMTRKEVATVLVKALQWENHEYDKKIIKNFSDSKLISGDASEKYIAIAVENGLMKGNADGSFNPAGVLTRAEVAQLIYNVYLQLRHLLYEQYDTVISTKPTIEIPEEVKNGTTTSYYNDYEYTENGKTMIQRVGRWNDEVYNITHVSSGTNIGPQISLDVVVGNQLLADGGSYTLNNDDKIYAFINNGSSVDNIYYMFIYGDNATYTTELQRVSGSMAIITIPKEITSRRIKLSISGTSVKNGMIYESTMQIIQFNYTNQPKVVEQDALVTTPVNGMHIDNEKSIIVSKEIDFIVIFNSDTYKEGGATFANAKADQKIIVRGKPVSNIQGIRYRWDNEAIEYIEGSTGTISIPKSFIKNSKHQLSIVIIEKGGKISEQKNYTVTISNTY